MGDVRSVLSPEIGSLTLECQLRNIDGRLHLRLVATGIRIGTEVTMCLAFKVFHYAKEDDLLLHSPDTVNMEVTDKLECHICLQEPGEMEMCRTSCDHCFHFECLSSWFRTKKWNCGKAALLPSVSQGVRPSVDEGDPTSDSGLC